MLPQPGRQISIHALREESDAHTYALKYYLFEFQSTPSARRATPLDFAVVSWL